MKKIITPTILLLSCVSFLNDISSEMLYPIMPVFLASIGFSTILIGILEGFAEAVAGLSKIYFGNLSDEKGKRMPFVRLGYLMSSVSKPMMAIFAFPLWIFLARTLDRLGKGVRTGARDAVLSDESLPQHKGTVFGFHRALDTAGAALGPLLALLYLHYYPEDYETLFLLAFLPAIISVGVTFAMREKRTISKKPASGSFIEKFLYWRKAPGDFKKVMIGLLIFGVMNSSDVFLLLHAKQITNDDSTVISIYILYNLVYAIFAFPLGRLADKIGMKRMLVFGILLFSVVYAGMAYSRTTLVVGILFFLYGIYAAATEGIAKALISNIVPRNETASAIGFYSGWNSVCALLASTVAGWIWYTSSSSSAFLVSAAGAISAAIYLAIVLRNKIASRIVDEKQIN